MKNASELRAEAREGLRGKWGLSVLTGWIAVSLGGALNYFGGGSILSRLISDKTEGLTEQFSNLKYADERALSLAVAMLVSALGVWITVALVFWIINLIIGGAVQLGYARFNLRLIDNKEEEQPSFNDIFTQFDYIWAGFCMRFWRWLYIFLQCDLILVIALIPCVLIWALASELVAILAITVITIAWVCFAIPITLNYKMTPYILYEYPEMSAREAIKTSKKMMYGNRWRYFCLSLSFIGWDILAYITFAIGGLWVRAYTEGAFAAFYRDISKDYYSEPTT